MDQMWDGQKNNKTLVWSLRVAGWILGSFENVSEVEQNFSAGDVVVSNLEKSPEWGFHWAIADKHGQSIVLEFQEGKPRIYRNTVGVMTNDPFFPWQVENLNSHSFSLRKDILSAGGCASKLSSCEFDGVSCAYYWAIEQCVHPSRGHWPRSFSFLHG